jgi:hypothetical protein
MKALPLLFAILLLLCPGQAAKAIVGDNAVPVSNALHPEACFIQIEHKDRPGNICTGTLVSSTQIYTAAHCFGRGYDPSLERTTVWCGGYSLGRIAKIDLPSNDLNHWEINPETLQERPILSSDFAVMHLPQAVQLRPMPLANGSEKYFDEFGTLRMGVACSFSGYGNTDAFSHNFQDQKLGSLIEAKIDLNRILITYSQTGVIITSAKNLGALPTSINTGDSGGSFICQARGFAPELVGVIINYARINSNDDTARSTNVMNPVWSIKP